MTDGPFRNAELSSRWKQYGRDLVSDAASADERTLQACHSMVGDLNVSEISSLLSAIKRHAERPQMDLDVMSSMEALFESGPKPPLIDTLQKHLMANLHDRMPLDTALDQALQSTVGDWIGITKNRLDEECIRARDLGDMKLEDYRKGIERNAETFAGINRSGLCEALTNGDKRTFKQAQQKKTGINEGPDD